MNGESKNLITLEVEGINSEHGHVRLEDFLKKLEDLLVTLNGIDRIVSQTFQPTLYYRIVEINHSSPLEITIEPVVRQQTPTAHEYIAVRHHRFFKELSAIRQNEPVSPEVDDRLIERLRDLVEGRGQSFAKASISNSEARVELDDVFEKNVRKLLAEEDCSYGGVDGALDSVNIHGTSRQFWIYPRIGAQKVRCEFLPGTSEQVREALGRYVRVEGLKYFRSPSPYPYRIAVKELEILDGEEESALINLRGIAPDATGELSSVEFVRAIRDEWD